MDKALRNTLRNVVTHCRKLLEDAVGEVLQGQFGIHADGKVEDVSRLTLPDEDLRYREDVLAHLEHIKASGVKAREATEQLIREAAFTHLNRLCAYKMMTSRGLIDDPVGKGLKSRGFMFYLSDHPEEEALYRSAQEEVAYRHYLDSINAQLLSEIGVLFAKEDLATRLFPTYRVLERVLDLINSDQLREVWAQDETIGWIFQYFTPKELRDKARKESAAPRNSYEMAFRNQFFTPRYVVEFLVDNTLGRTWYEMRGGETILAERCRYLARLGDDGDARPPGRQKKDPRKIKVLDPACGSGHFLLYCFDVLQAIYEEAYDDADLGPALQTDFPDREEFKRKIPGLILSHNIHGIDIDLRVTQLAALALWMRAQRTFREMGLDKGDRPRIQRMNLVCAEPMPGEETLLEEFINEELKPHVLGDLMANLVRNVFDRMKLAGDAGALVRIEDDIREPIEEARKQWADRLRRNAEREDEMAKEGALFEYRKDELQNRLVFDIADITNERVWHDAEVQVVEGLREYANRASNGNQTQRRLFANDAEQGFAFIEICRKKFDVVLMNPPFGDASLPSKPYIDDVYGDTKGDVYKAFVECFQDRLVPGGFLGIISSRTGFFLSGSSDWRERIVLRLYRPIVLADFGMGVLDAMVETAAYVLRSLTEEEDHQLTLQLARDLKHVPTDKNDLFSTKKYEVTRGVKRHQANGELRRLHDAGFIKPVEGHFPRWLPLQGEIIKAPAATNAPFPSLVCLRLLSEDNKGQALNKALHRAHDPRRFVVSPEDFQQVPNTPFCYWVSNQIRSLFVELPQFEDGERIVRQGAVTGDDARHVRAWWEVSPFSNTEEFAWVPFAKGGRSIPFYSDQTLVTGWDFNLGTFKGYTGLLHRPSLAPANSTLFFRPGLTWLLRAARFCPTVLPEGCIFSIRGYAILAPPKTLLTLLAFTSSGIFDYIFKSALGRYEYPEFVVGVLQKLPLPDLNSYSVDLEKLANNSFVVQRGIATSDETNHAFHLPALLQANSDTLAARMAAWQSRVEEAEQQLAADQREIDDIAFRLYGISDEDRCAIEVSVSQPSLEGDGEQTETDDAAEDENAYTDQRQLTAGVIAYAVGCAFGRWDVRFATGGRPIPELPDPFTPLPICAPGALTGDAGLPLTQAPTGYPLRIDSDGVLVDDPTHEDDVLLRVRAVLN